MKNIRIIIAMMACIMMTLGAFAQSPTPGTPPAPATTPTAASPTGDPILTNPTMNTRLSADLGYRNADLRSNPVSWYDTGNGYYGTYSIAGKDYMTRYDQDGRYQQTLVKGDWNDSDTPAELKASFEKSPYKSQEVANYWKVTDSGHTGYYLETKTPQGKTTKVWADENGKLSKTAPKYTTPSATTTPKQ